MSIGWPLVPLAKVARPISRVVSVTSGETYRTIGVRWWGEGAYERQTIDGSQTAAKTLNIVRENDLIINKIWVRHGSTAIASAAVDGCAASGEFPMFELDPSRVMPRWIHWLTKMRPFWDSCDRLSQGTSGKNRIRPELFLTILVPLPPLHEQQRIVAHIEELVGKITQAGELRRESRRDMRAALLASYSAIIKDACRFTMSTVAPLVRRPINVIEETLYPELGIRSFGKGTFHKSPVRGSEIGSKRLFGIEPGDLLFNIVFAWEGAVAIAKPEDVGRVGSHRFLTRVVNPDLALASYLCFHFLTERGLEQLPASISRWRRKKSHSRPQNIGEN